MILVLNGYPGVGKLTIGRLVAQQLSGRLLDIHTIYNVAFALTEFKTPEFYSAVEQVEEVAHDLARARPAGEPLVLTTVLAGEGEWGDAEWNRIVELAEDRPPLCVAHVHCDLEENEQRIQSDDRGAMHKPRDPALAQRNHRDAKTLYGLNAQHLLKLDTTSLTAQESADAIVEWAGSIQT